MDNPGTTPSAAEEISVEEIADVLYVDATAEASTIGEVRGDVAALMTDIADPEINARLQEISTAIDTVSVGGKFDDVVIAHNLPPEVLGQNKLGQDEAEVNTTQFQDPQELVVNTRFVVDTVLHEASEDYGHAGQDPNAYATIIVDGKLVESTVVYEGEVVAGVADHLGQVRENLPQDVYMEGYHVVDTLGGADQVGKYIRLDGEHQGEHLQVLVWEQNSDVTLDDMLRDANTLGIPSDVVLRKAQELGKISAEYQLAP